MPEFHVYNDGRLVTYVQMAAAVRGGFPRLRSIETELRDLRVLVLSAEDALVTATFRREAITEATGAGNRSQGAVTWLWRNIDRE